VHSNEYSTDLCGGLSVFVGDMAGPGARPGPFISVGPSLRINDYFGLGFHADYSWITRRTGISGAHEGVHMPDISCVPKLFIPLYENTSVYFEADPGFALLISYKRDQDYSAHYLEPGFMMTFGAGLQAKKLLAGFKFKSVVKDFISLNRVNFYMGYSFD
jgi:hypothetical protein